MKLLIAFLILCISTLHSQEFTSTQIQHPKFLIGAKMKANFEKKHYLNTYPVFNSYEHFKQRYSPKFKAAFYSNSDKSATDFEKIKNLVFNVVSYLNSEGIEGKDNSESYKKYFLKFANNEGETFIIEYDNYSIPFLFSGVVLDEKYYSSLINKKYDEFEYKTTYFSPSERRRVEVFKTFYKDGKITTTLKLNAFGESSPTIDGKGVTILLENNDRIEIPNVPILISATSRGYSYTAYIELNSEQIEKLINSNIYKYKLAYYENEEYSEFKKDLSGYLKYLNKITK